ncbi:hypothetical protein HZS_830 [Henneguya salminicola]|nr:hypothetical protein HZS_830 [Henneguya salminicola]
MLTLILYRYICTPRDNPEINIAAREILAFFQPSQDSPRSFNYMRGELPYDLVFIIQTLHHTYINERVRFIDPTNFERRFLSLFPASFRRFTIGFLIG